MPNLDNNQGSFSFEELAPEAVVRDSEQAKREAQVRMDLRDVSNAAGVLGAAGIAERISEARRKERACRERSQLRLNAFSPYAAYEYLKMASVHGRRAVMYEELPAGRSIDLSAMARFELEQEREALSAVEKTRASESYQNLSWFGKHHMTWSERRAINGRLRSGLIYSGTPISTNGPAMYVALLRDHGGDIPRREADWQGPKLYSVEDARLWVGGHLGDQFSF